MPMWIVWAALAGAVASQVWYTIAWMVLPHHHGDFQSLGRGSAIDSALQTLKPAPGLYMVPHYKDFAGGFKDPALEERMKAGARGWFVVQPAGCAMGKTFLAGFVLNVL